MQEPPSLERVPLDVYDPELFFASQVINDACATYALLSILLNRTRDLDVGPELRNLRDFTQGLASSKDRGWAIGNSEVVRTAHNSFARQDPFDFE